jgi:hypothetical protein
VAFVLAACAIWLASKPMRTVDVTQAGHRSIFRSVGLSLHCTGRQPTRQLGEPVGETLSFLRRFRDNAGAQGLPWPRRRLLFAALAMLTGCTREIKMPQAAPTTGHRPPPERRALHASDFAKSDIDSAAEILLQESLASTRLLTEKLYRRNPREWRRGGYPSLEAALGRAFDPKFDWRFPELGYARSTEALQLAFLPEFTGDRVFAFGVGMGSMIMVAYGISPGRPASVPSAPAPAR